MQRHSANSGSYQSSTSASPRMWTACSCVALILALSIIWPRQGYAQRDSFKPLQQTVKVLSTNLEGFGIPFKVSGKNGQFIEAQLYMSRDRGETWSFHSRQPTSAREFPFTSDGDGEYWFAIKTLDRDRRLLPDGDARAELKIVVDTSKPELMFQIESDAAGRVVCRWQASDEGLDARSLKIEYRASAGELSNVPVDDSWQSVPFQLDQKIQNQTWADQLGWWPDTSAEQLEVRVRVSDFAGNESTASRYVAVKRASWRTRSTGSTLGQTQPSQQSFRSVQKSTDSYGSAKWQRKLKPFANNNPQVAEAPAQAVAQADGNRWRINETAAPQVPTRIASSQLPPGVDLAAPPAPLDWNEPVVMPQSGQSGNSNRPGDSIPWESEVQRHESAERSYMGSTMSPAPEIAPIQRPLSPRSTDSIPSNPGTKVRSGENIIIESTTSWPDNQWKGPTTAKVQPRNELAPGAGRFVPIPRPLSEMNPSNFSNAGFKKPQSDSNTVSNEPSRPSAMMPQSANTQIISTKRFKLNYDINAIDPSGVGRVDLWMTRDRGQTWKLWGQDPDNVSPFPVEVTQEGIYGFRIVVRSKDGLAGRGPMRGEEADMWIQVDVTAPMAKITSVPYGTGSEAGQLVINYSVTDSNLTLRPNSILWSTNPDGPWTLIQENLRNDRRLVWKPQQNVPHRIFLRLEAADRAGNVGVHHLEQAIDISGLVPRGTIFGVVPVGE